jgi:redox-sensing transcriptional repressor
MVADSDEPLPSRATAGRLSLYLRRLEAWEGEGQQTASSPQLAKSLDLREAQVRRDLAGLGNLGRRGVGYKIPALVMAIRAALGIDREWHAIVVGAGNLARALLRYRGFQERGFRIVSLFDSDPRKVGERIEHLLVAPISDLKRLVRQENVELALVAVPSEAAQDVANQLVEAGIRGVLNFAPAVLRLPSHVRVVNVDLTIQLEQLAFQVQTRGS